MRETWDGKSYGCVTDHQDLPLKLSKVVLVGNSHGYLDGLWFTWLFTMFNLLGASLFVA